MRRPALRTALALCANGLLVALVFGPYLGIPLRLHDHHLVLLLVQTPDLVPENFFWRLVHHRLGGGAEMYFRFLSYPSIYGLGSLFGENPVPHYLVHFAAHLGAGLVLYRLACALCGRPGIAAGIWSLFTVFTGACDMAGMPYYTHLCLATALAGLALLRTLRHLADGRTASLVSAVAFSALATFLYDTFLLMTLALPFLATAARRRSWRAAFSPGFPGWMTSACVLAFFFLVTLTQSLVPEHFRPSAIDQSLLRTLQVTLQQAPFASAVSLAKHAVDVFFLFPGHLPDVSHRGNMPYWDAPSMATGTLTGIAAALLAAVGFGSLRRSGSASRGIGILAGAIALWLDWRAVPLAALAWCVRPDNALRNAPVLLFLAGCGFLCALNTAIGRSSWYSIQAIRHHYVSGFVLLAGLALLLRGTDRARTALAALAVLVLANGWSSTAFLRDYGKTNAPVLSFHRELARRGADGETASVFVGDTPGRIRSPDWNGQVGQDWVFDILHGGKNPLTRHVGRARFLYENGRFVENPLHGTPALPDFRLEFRLSTKESALRFDAREAFACFGRKSGDPCLEITRDGFRFSVTRRADGARVAYPFPLPVETNPFFREIKAVTLVREGRFLSLTAGGHPAGSHEIREPDEYLPWGSDNTDLLGRDSEMLMAKLALFDTYIRIGPALPGRVL